MSGSSQSGSGTTTLDPQIEKEFGQVFDQAQGVASALNKAPVPQQQVAALTADQTAANNLLNKQINNGVAEHTVNQGINAALDASNYKPQRVDPAQISGRGVEYLTEDPTTAGNAADAQKVTYDRSAVSNVQAPTLQGVNLKKYQDPYQDQVVNQTISDAERARQIQQQDDKSSAIAAHAFGGSREGVQKALTNDAFQRNLDTTLAGLNSAGYTQATGLAETDLNRGVTADQSNQNADLTVFGQDSAQKQQTALANAAAQNERQQYNATNKQQMDLANQSAGNTARLQTAANDQQARVLNSQQNLAAQTANQGAGLTANAQATTAADLLGRLGGQQQTMGENDVTALNTEGSVLQNQSQNQLNAVYNNAQAQRQAPVDALNVAESPFKVIPTTASGSTTTSSGKGMGI